MSEWAYNKTDLSNQHLMLPANHVLLLQSNSKNCYNKESCCNEMYTLNLLYMNRTNQSDFIANFMVGGDGRTYEANGWTCKSNYSIDNSTLTVGLIGK